MLYRYEMHCHCSQCSACAISTSQEMVRAYYDAGYAGMVMTDHFCLGNSAVDRTIPWAEQIECYYKAYLEACNAAKDLDFDVIFGIEHGYGNGKEVLLYGIDSQFLADNPDIPLLTLDELAARVHAAGGIMVQAHPYRNRRYIDMSIPPRDDLVDGLEVYNVGNKPGEDRQALSLSRTRPFILTSGGDSHWTEQAKPGRAGIALPYRVHNEKELVSALKRADHRLIIDGKILQEVTEEDLP